MEYVLWAIVGVGLSFVIAVAVMFAYAIVGDAFRWSIRRAIRYQLDMVKDHQAMLSVHRDRILSLESDFEELNDRIDRLRIIDSGSSQ